MIGQIRPSDAVAAGSVILAVVVGYHYGRLPGLFIGLAVVTVQWAMLRRTIYDAYRSGCDIERLDEIRRRIEAVNDDPQGRHRVER